MIKLSFYFFWFLLGLFIFFSSGVIDTQDGFQYLVVSRNIYYHHEPTAPSPLEYNSRENIPMSTYKGANGKYYSPTGLGYSLALLPAVFTADQFYNHFHVRPPEHFPLQSDWIIQLAGSFTNAFFAAMLGIILLLYFLKLGLSKQQSLFMTLVSLFSTNLFIYGKDVLAHMMFTTLLMLTFYFIKIFSIEKNQRYLLLAGLSYGITAITYNQTFILSFPVLFTYYFMLNSLKTDLTSLKVILKHSFFIFIGLLPFIFIYLWFENLRARPTINLNDASSLFSILLMSIRVPVSVFFEGLYGQLFSPGRSIFIYSPLLLIIPIFWAKLKNTAIKPELISFILLSIIYVIFYATQYSIGKGDQGITALWHGEASWGPRYLLPLIPLGMLIVGYIFTKLSRKELLFIFYPLLAFGLYIQVLGVIMPDQIKFHNMQKDFFVNGSQYTYFSYVNLLPRYSPILTMSKNLFQFPKNTALTLNHGEFNIRFYDGIDFPFDVGPYRWRAIEQQGHIKFDNSQTDPIKKMSLEIGIQPITAASSSAVLQFKLNNQDIGQTSYLIKENSTQNIDLNTENISLIPNDNELSVVTEYTNPEAYKYKTQIIVIKSFSVNDKPANLESLDVPYIYNFAQPLTGAKYQTYGKLITDPWKAWEIHTQIYERTPDFWWIKPLYYWDLPKKIFGIIFILDLVFILWFGYKILKVIKS